MQTADVWDRDDRPACRWLGSPRDGRILVQREVRAPRVIVGEVALQVAAQCAFVPHDDVIEALASVLKGVSLDSVSKLLGHSSIKITERHYAPWVKARQEQLESEVRRIWIQ